jgi:hypothetical protein
LDAAALKISAQYTLTPKKYAAFISFYEQWLQDTDSRGLLQPFDILLLYQPTNPEYPLQNFRCAFSTDPITTTQPEGTGIIVQCTFIGYEFQPHPQSTLYPVMQSDAVSVFAFGGLSPKGWGVLPEKGPQQGGITYLSGAITTYGTQTYTSPVEVGPQQGGVTYLSGTITTYGTQTYTSPVEAGPQQGGITYLSGVLTEYLTITYTSPVEVGPQQGGITYLSGALT